MRALCRDVLAACGAATILLFAGDTRGPAPADAAPRARQASRGGVAIVARDVRLGIAVTVPLGLQQDTYGVPLGVLNLVDPRVSVYNEFTRLRLSISSLGTTRNKDEARAAAAAMRALLRGIRVPVMLVPVRYGGAPGLLTHMAASPRPVTTIVFAHAGAIYKILAPGRSLAPDQSQALTSLRFIVRIGPFPPSTL